MYFFSENDTRRIIQKTLFAPLAIVWNGDPNNREHSLGRQVWKLVKLDIGYSEFNIFVLTLLLTKTFNWNYWRNLHCIFIDQCHP